MNTGFCKKCDKETNFEPILVLLDYLSQLGVYKWKCVVCGTITATGVKAEEEKALASRIVTRILADLTDRRGFRQAWDCVDNDVRNEIKKTWKKIVEEELKQEDLDDASVD